MDNCRISIDPNVFKCCLLIPENRTSTKMRLNICRMSWNEINDLLVTFPFPAWIPHKDKSSSEMALMSNRRWG